MTARGLVVVLTLSCFAWLAAAAGCSAPLPTYPWTSHEDALRTVAERHAGVRTLRSSARLVLTRGSDDSQVALDAALLAEPPDRLRLRAWKLGHAVFDLTVAPEGVWLKANDGRLSDEVGVQRLTPESLARAWAAVLGESIPAEGVDILDGGEGSFLASWRLMGEGGRLAAEIDRATRTPRRYVLTDEAGGEVATIILKRYRAVGGIVLPTRISARGGEGSATITLSDPEINTDLPASAFTPPAGAVRRP